MKKKFTRDEVKDILISVLFFAASSNGLNKIRGNTFGQQANNIIEVMENSDIPININFK